jgi:DNA-binding NarL/FixJ family response regulator
MNDAHSEPRSLKAGLTKAEAAVLALVDGGLSNQQIAVQLSISVGTVKCHLHRVYEKLQVRNRTEAAVRAREHGQFGAGASSTRDSMNSAG